MADATALDQSATVTLRLVQLSILPDYNLAPEIPHQLEAYARWVLR